MITRLSARSSTLRCALCHGDLGPRVRTCAGCRTTLHHDCARRLDECPTLGCGRRRLPRRRPCTQPPVPDARLVALTFWVPAVLTFVWPLTFLAGVLLRDALGLAGPVFIGPSLDYVVPILVFALGLGPSVGHLVLAPLSGVPGRHRRATLGAALGLALSVLIVLGFAATA